MTWSIAGVAGPLSTEERAGIEHVKGHGWHSVRRNFATELSEIPLKELCELGGWKSPQTLLMCYQQPDQERLREALLRRTTFGAATNRRNQPTESGQTEDTPKVGRSLKLL